MRKIAITATISALMVVGAAWWAISAAGTSTLSTQKATRAETSFGDLSADALCSAAKCTVGLVAAVAFKPGTIPADNPTAQQIASLLQTPDEKWAVSKLTGAQIRAAFERSLSRLPLPNSAFLQVSGLKVKYNPKAPRNRRITSLQTNTGPLQVNKTYQVVMPLFLAKGGSGYFQIFDKDDIVRQGNTGLAAVIKKFVDSKDELNYTGQGRITVGR